jgi:hypothetical protein
VGELDLCKDCVEYPGVVGFQDAIRTVFVTWLPLAAAGVGLDRWRVARATMRGAGLLRLLARLAIAIQLAAATIPLTIVPMFLEAAWSGDISFDQGFVAVVIGFCVLLPIVAISTFGIIAWHRVLLALASREGEGRMLV